MAVSCQVVRFTKDSTNVDNATQDVNLNFTPKAIIVYSDCNTADNTASAHYQTSIGFSDGTNSAVMVATSDDADAAADIQRYYNTDGVYLRMLETSNSTIEERATVAFGTNKVTFTWAVNSADATRLILIAYGGNDITNAKVNTVDVGRNTAGTQDYTGLGFNPTDNNSVLFTLGGFDNVLSTSSQSTGWVAFGCATSATKEWAVNNNMENTADPSDTWRVTASDRCIKVLTPADGTLFADAEFSAWITDGFRLNWVDPADATTRKFSYLVINGGTWDVGTLTSPTSATNNVDTAVSVSSFPIKGLLIAGCGDTTSNTIDTVSSISIGSTDGTTQASIGNIDEDAQATTDSYRVNNDVNIVRLLTTNGANLEVATFDSFTTNNFRLDWGTATASQELYGWVVLADQFTITEVSTTKTHKYNILSTATQSKTHKYNIISQITKSKTHKYNILKLVSLSRTHKYNILEQVPKAAVHVYNIIGKITQSKTHKYNILQLITQSKTHKYNILALVSNLKTHLYHVIAVITQSKTHKYNILQLVSPSKTHKYNVSSSATQVSTTKTHKYNIEYGVTTTKTHKYDVIGKVTTSKTHRWNILQTVTSQKTHIFNLLASIALSATHKYNILSSVLPSKTHKYNIISALAAVTKTHKYDISGTIEVVSTTKTHLFNIIQKITAQKTHEFNIIEQVTLLRTHLYNLAGKVTQSKAHLFNIVQKVTFSKQHRFNLLQFVETITKTHKYSILNAVSISKTHKYNVIARVTTSKTHIYDMGGKVLVVKWHRYDVSTGFLQQELGGSTHALIRFPERIKIIDIISNINNKAVANLELITNVKDNSNLAIATVVISGFEFQTLDNRHLLTASIPHHKPKILVASGLILPEIIDTIENVAVSPYIAVEILEPQQNTQLQQVRSLVRLQANKNHDMFLNALTQINETDKTKINVASAATELVTITNNNEKTLANVKIPYNFKNQTFKVENIMPEDRAKKLKVLIDLLKSDHLFE